MSLGLVTLFAALFASEVASEPAVAASLLACEAALLAIEACDFASSAKLCTAFDADEA